jgi:hypothetical protein
MSIRSAFGKVLDALADRGKGEGWTYAIVPRRRNMSEDEMGREFCGHASAYWGGRGLRLVGGSSF